MRKKRVWTEKERILSGVLQPLFELGLSVTKACSYAGIPQRTVQDWIEKDDALRLKVTMWQNEISLIARKNIVAKIKSNKPDSFAVSQWWLKTRERDEFAERQEVQQSSEMSYTELQSAVAKQ